MSLAILPAEDGTFIVVTYVVSARAADSMTIQLVRVVPAQMEDSLRLGQPVTPSRDEKISILKAIGILEFGEQLPAEGGAR